MFMAECVQFTRSHDFSSTMPRFEAHPSALTISVTTM